MSALICRCPSLIRSHTEGSKVDACTARDLSINYRETALLVCPLRELIILGWNLHPVCVQVQKHWLCMATRWSKWEHVQLKADLQRMAR